MAGKHYIIIFICILTSLGYATAVAQPNANILVEKPSCLIGEHNSITYTIIADNVSDTIFPSNYHFEKVSIIESGLLKKENGSYTKKFIFTHFDSGMVKLPTFQWKDATQKKPSCIFIFLPKDKIMDSILPKLPKDAIMQDFNKEGFFGKYKWLLLAAIIIILLVVILVKKLNGNTNTISLKEKPKVTSATIQGLLPGNSQEASAVLYTSLRNAIIEVLYEKKYLQNQSPTISDLKFTIEKYEKDISDINLLEQVLLISEPTLYAKYYPNIDAQQKHIASVAHFIKLETGR
jgi:hypothetical protein